jgi:hypothetical protein
LGPQSGTPVCLWADPQWDLAAVWPVRLFAAFRAKVEIIIDAVAKGLLDFGKSAAFEGDHIAQPSDTTDKGSLVSFDSPKIPFIFEHLRSLLLGVHARGYKKIADSAHQPPLGFGVRVRPMKHRPRSTQSNADTASSSFADLGSERLQQRLDVTPSKIGGGRFRKNPIEGASLSAVHQL